jgi:hypothetical protein
MCNNSSIVIIRMCDVLDLVEHDMKAFGHWDVKNYAM